MLAFTYHVLVLEWRSWPRKRWHYTRRLAYAGLMALVVFWGFFHGLVDQGGAKGLLILRDLGVLVLCLSLFTAPMAIASRLQRERQEQTLGLLLLTSVGTGEYLLARLLTALAGSLTSLLSVLPMLLLAASMGGVTIGQWLASGVLLAGVLLSASALGLLLSTWLPRERWLYLAILVAILLWQIGVPCLALLPGPVWLQHCQDSAVVLVFLAILRDPAQDWLALLLPYVAWTAGWSLLFLVVGAWRLRRWALRDPANPGRLASWRVRLTARLGGAGVATVAHAGRARRWQLGQHEPLYWRDFYCRYGGRTPLLGVLLMVAYAAMILALLILDWLSSAVVGPSLAWGGMIVSFLLLAAGYVPRIVAALEDERQQGTGVLLLCSGMSESAILKGKVNAILRLQWPLLVLLAMAVLLGFSTGHWGQRLGFLFGLCWLAINWYMSLWLSVYLALRLRHHAMALTTAGMAVLLLFGPCIWGVLTMLGGLLGGPLGVVAALGPLFTGLIARMEALRLLRRCLSGQA